MFGSHGSLELVNKSNEIIEYYLIVVELLNEHGNYILSVPVLNESRDRSIPFKTAFEPWLQTSAADYFEPVAPHETVRKPFFSQLATPKCPTSARIALIFVRFSDGKEQRYGDWPEIPPALIQPFFSTTAKLEDWSGRVVQVDLALNASGGAKLEKSSLNVPGFNDWLKTEVANWKFTPGFKEGKPAPIHLPVLLFIGTSVKPTEMHDPLTQADAVLVISVAPPELSLNGEWQIFYGKDIINLSVKASQ
jgi:hypothetical protein